MRGNRKNKQIIDVTPEVSRTIYLPNAKLKWILPPFTIIRPFRFFQKCMYLEAF
jgi:hypothetical protein